MRPSSGWPCVTRCVVRWTSTSRLSAIAFVQNLIDQGAITGAFGTHRLPSSLTDLETADAIIAIASDLEESHPVAALRIKDAAVKKHAALVVISAHWGELDSFAAGVLRVGTQGWNYDAWVGPFYPTGTRPANYLQTYARAFNTVEVDSTFYAVPPMKTAARPRRIGRCLAAAA